MKKLAVITGVIEELNGSASPGDYSIGPVLESGMFNDVVLAVPDNDDALELQLLADKTGIDFIVGDQYNVYNRLQKAIARFHCDIISRFQLRASWVDLELVRRSLDLVSDGYEFVDYANNINYAMGCDTFSLDAFNKVGAIIADLPETDPERKTYEFSPWACMQNERVFKVGKVHFSGFYSPDKALSIRRHLNSLIGRKQNMIGSPVNAPALRYLKAGSMLQPHWRVGEISAGLGGGAAYMSTITPNLTAYEIDPLYFDQARQNYSKYPVTYVLGGGDVLCMQVQQFDCIVSMHTLEHVPNDRTFIQQIRQALRLGGLLILEVPRLMEVPMGMPLWPFHEREYSLSEVRELLHSEGFDIRTEFGVSRNNYVEIHKAREAMMFVAERCN